MDKRKFLKVSAIAATGSLILPHMACSPGGDKKEAIKETNKTTVSSFELPKLGFAYDAIKGVVDAETMEIHHGKHHAGYVRKLNKALVDSTLAGKGLVDILESVKADDKGVRNNGGGHYNHSLFWRLLKPGGKPLQNGALKDAINKTFGSVDEALTKLQEAGAKQFGSGWAWLAKAKDGSLYITSTANQDNPLMKNIVKKTGQPLIGIDVWEHAYYLKYQNLRKTYLKNITSIINWDVVEEMYRG